jgi:hypothetical protein
MSQSISFNQIKAKVAALRHKKPVEKPVGIRSAGRWLGEAVQTDGDTTYSIWQCDSPLALRLALRGAAAAGDGPTVRVVVTNLDDSAISPDIFARLHKQRFVTIDRWSLVQQLFAAESIDPRLVKHDWLADAVVEHLGGRRTTTAKSGFLDAETLWRELLTATIGLSADVPDLSALLRWSLDASRVRRFRQLPEPLRHGIEQWLKGRAGEAAEFVFAVASHTDKPDAVPLALAAGVLVDEKARGKSDRAIGKLEGTWLGGRRVTADDLGRVAGEAAALLRAHVADPGEQRRITGRAEELLRDVDGAAFAHVSPILPLGYTQRLAAFAETAQRFAAGTSTDITAVDQAAEHVRTHDQAHLNRIDTDRLAMAMRLVRWLQMVRTRASSPGSFAEAARAYLAEGSYVDWARASTGRVAASRELSEAIATVHAAATREQEGRAREFAMLLENSVSTGVFSADVLLIEQVLDEVVVPLARTMPVLLVVLDGMSAAVCRELVEHLTKDKREWLEIVAQGRATLRPAVATIPCETKYSRASLLSGRLTADSPDEKTAFAAHAGLNGVSPGGRGPVLYTKSDLSGSTLSDVVRDEIASPQRRVVGTIVNAVDDHLAKADQIEVRWNLDTVQILGALLHEASSAGRAVILTSDHGHILEGGTTARVSEGGERWRPLGVPAAASDEIAIRGTRVLSPDGAIVTSWSETVRYIAATKRGYHGGLNPQEMVVPISVLIPSGAQEPAGWQLKPEATPTWWDSAVEPAPQHAATPVSTPKPAGMLFDIHRDEPQPVTHAASSAGGECVGTGGDVAIPTWTNRVFETEVFATQKKLVPRGYPGDDVLKRLLANLDARGGKLTTAALARTMGYATVRLPGLLSVAQRLFNVDGYPVIGLDIQSDTVQLEKQLLLVQFGLEGGGAGIR